MHRFFADPAAFLNGRVEITGPDAVHITSVLRLCAGDCVTVCDGAQNDYVCEIVSAGRSAVLLSVKEVRRADAEPETAVTLYQGLPKSDKMDGIVKRCVELGVCRIVPVDTRRVVARPKDGQKKCMRWQKIAHEAAKQCGRGILPEVSGILPFEQAVLDAEGCDLKLFPYEEDRAHSLKPVLLQKTPKTAAVFIGPEGGFDPKEAEFAKNHGWSLVSLGPRILRTETAGAAVLSVLLYELGGWEPVTSSKKGDKIL